MPQQIRAIAVWPDGLQLKSEWMSERGDASDAMLTAGLEVLNQRPGFVDAKITWESREVETQTVEIGNSEGAVIPL